MFLSTVPAAALIPIDSVSASGFTVPKIGQTASDNLATVTIPEDAPYSVNNIYWYDNSSYYDHATGFEAGKTYFLVFNFTPKDGYCFDSHHTPTVLINGSDEYLSEDYTWMTQDLIAFYTIDLEPVEPGVLYGDVNSDGVVNLKDATLIRRYYVGGWGVDLDIATADVNCDGVVNLKDATLIRRYYVGGWDVVFGPQS